MKAFVGDDGHAYGLISSLTARRFPAISTRRVDVASFDSRQPCFQAYLDERGQMDGHYGDDISIESRAEIRRIGGRDCRGRQMSGGGL